MLSKELRILLASKYNPKLVEQSKYILKLTLPASLLEEGFSRDVGTTGHYGTGDLELTIKTLADLDKAQPLIELSYRKN